MEDLVLINCGKINLMYMGNLKIIVHNKKLIEFQKTINVIISCHHRSGIWDRETMQLSRWKKILSVYPRKTKKYNKLNCKNAIKGINTSLISTVIYSTPFLHYVIRLRKMDHRSRKLMIIKPCIQINISRDYMWKEGLVSTDYCIK